MLRTPYQRRNILNGDSTHSCPSPSPGLICGCTFTVSIIVKFYPYYGVGRISRGTNIPNMAQRQMGAPNDKPLNSFIDSTSGWFWALWCFKGISLCSSYEKHMYYICSDTEMFNLFLSPSCPHFLSTSCFANSTTSTIRHIHCDKTLQCHCFFTMGYVWWNSVIWLSTEIDLNDRRSNWNSPFH